MGKIFNEDEPVEECPTCGAEVTGIYEVFNADGKKISTEDYFSTSYVSPKDKVATWLFIQWACSKETQAATSHKFAGAYKRVGVNRNSVWKNPDFQSLMSKMGDNFVDTSIKSYNNDTDPDWRPRTVHWPAVGGEMATAIQAALVGEKSSKQALLDAQTKIDKIMKG